MNCEIIQFSTFAAATKEAKHAAGEPYSPAGLDECLSERLARQARRIAVLETAPETLTVTCRNHVYANSARSLGARRKLRPDIGAPDGLV
jgi:hypothetical protein